MIREDDRDQKLFFDDIARRVEVLDSFYQSVAKAR